MDDIQHLSSLMERLDPDRVPAHVAIIMDGNGRWAKARGLDRSEGHVEGVTTVRRITEIASEAGVKCLTLYAFSTENWHRPQAEVDALMHLIGIAIERETPDLIKNNVRLTMIGDFARMPADPRRRLEGCFAATAHCTGLVLNLALSYSGRWDIVNAARSLAARAAAGELAATDSDEALFASSLSRPRPAYTHRGRPPRFQLPALADCLRRDCRHTEILARFLQGRFCGDAPPLPGARAAFRTHFRAGERTSRQVTFVNH